MGEESGSHGRDPSGSTGRGRPGHEWPRFPFKRSLLLALTLHLDCSKMEPAPAVAQLPTASGVTEGSLTR